MVLTNEDILAVVKILVDLRNGRGEVDDIDTWATPGALRRRAGREPVPHRPGPHREGVKERLGRRARAADAARPDNSKPISAALKESSAPRSCRSSWTRQPAVRDHAQAPRLGPGPGGLTRERAGFEVRDVHVTTTAACADRNAEAEHRPDQLAGPVRALNEYGFIETPYRRVMTRR